MGNLAHNVSAITTSPISDNNTVMENSPDPFVSKMGYLWDTIIGLTILFIIVIGAMLNGMALWTLIGCTSIKLQRQHLNITDYYIIVLAASDLSAVLLCYPLTLASTVSHKWLFGDMGCVVNAFCGFLFSLVDIGVLASMSVVRLLSVKMPHLALIKTRRCTLAICVCVILYALVWTVPPFWDGEATPLNHLERHVRLTGEIRIKAVFIGALVLPFLIMLVCYSGVVHHMNVSTARLGSLNGRKEKRAKRQNRLVRMAVLMCFCFTIIWLPYAVLSICFAYVPDFDVEPVQSAIPTVLAKASHVMNPVIYFTMNPSYRRRIQCKCLRRILCLSNFKNGEQSRDSDLGPSGKSSEQVTQLRECSYITRSPFKDLNLRQSTMKPDQHIYLTNYSIPVCKYGASTATNV